MPALREKSEGADRWGGDEFEIFYCGVTRNRQVFCVNFNRWAARRVRVPRGGFSYLGSMCFFCLLPFSVLMTYVALIKCVYKRVKDIMESTKHKLHTFQIRMK
jgi:hypothetical protein